jgi:hypothetical protein
MFEIKRLDFDDDDKVNDVSPLKDFMKLEYLSIMGDVETLEPLRKIPRLEKVMVNRKIIKDLKLPFSDPKGKANKTLLEVCERGDLAGAKKALKDGADINAKGEYATTPLHEACKSHNMELMLFLIGKGADIHAVSQFDMTPLSFCGPDECEKLKEAYKKAGGKDPDSPFRSWVDGPSGKNVASLSFLQGVKKDYEIGDGIPMLKRWPKDAHFKMRTDYPGYKRDTKLQDVWVPFYGTPVVSKRVKGFLEKKKLKNVEYLPVNILDHKGKVADKDYFIVHPIKAQDCLDIEASEPEYNLINEDEISEVKRLVIDDKRLDKKVQMFRIEGYSKELFVRKDLALEMVEQGFTGLLFKLPRR